MKKLLLFAALALVFASCQKDEDSLLKEGRAAVSVKLIDSPLTKATLADKTTGEDASTVKLDWDAANVSFSATKGGFVNNLIGKGMLQDVAGYIIYDVMNPVKLEVGINGGVEEYSKLDDLADLTPAGMQSYGNTTTFTLDGTVTDYSNNKEYAKYDASVETKIPVARMEVGGVKFHTEGTKMSNIKLAGIFLDAAAVAPKTPVKYEVASTGAVSYSKVAADEENHVDYADFKKNKGILAIDIVDDQTPAFKDGGVYPVASSNKVYAFNFFGQETTLPILKFYFTDCEMTAGTCEKIQYASVDKYKIAGGAEITSFEPGKIYRIKSIEIADGNLHSSIDDSKEYAIVATVEIADWTICDTEVTLK